MTRTGTFKKIWLWVLFVIYLLMLIGDFVGIFGGVTISKVAILLINSVSMGGVLVLLFAQRKMGFLMMCLGAVLELIFNVIVLISIAATLNTILIAWNVFVIIISGLMVPGITYLFIRTEWERMA